MSVTKRVAETLLRRVRPARRARLVETASRRTGGVHLVLENLANAQNIAAIFRTAEGLGVQNVHVCHSYCTAFESSQYGRWLTLHAHSHIRGAVDAVRAAGCTVLASDFAAEDARPLDGFAFGAQGDDGGRRLPVRGPVALVLGNENRGLSKLAVRLADHSFYLPMTSQLTRCYNVGVSAAMALYHMQLAGALDEPLPKEERDLVLARWATMVVPNARTYLADEGIELEDF